MDAPRSNSPSRKSRFRSQSGAAYRTNAPAEESAPVESELDAPVYSEEEIYADGVPVEAETIDPLAVEAPVEEDQTGFAPEPEAPPAEEDSLPAGLRLTRSSDESLVRRGVVSGWLAALGMVCGLLLGGIGGYFLRSNGPAMASNAATSQAAAERTAPVIALGPAVLAEVDAAFVANKTANFADARQRFDALAELHPNWISMRIEAARTTLYEHDFDAAAQILATIQRTGANADAEFLSGLLQMTAQTYDKAEAAFEKAIAIDPARGDIFYFWGECLRREGKPREAADKFREALLRNQYETAEGLYQLKLWLSEIQADQETAKETNAKIDADLASGHPSGPALFAAAAREIKAGEYKEAGAHIGQAQKVMEPAVFRVVLQDPTFLEQDFRPELAPFYQS